MCQTYYECNDEYYTYPTTVTYGWVCPRCNTVWGPHVWTCTNCSQSPHTYQWTYTDGNAEEAPDGSA